MKKLIVSYHQSRDKAKRFFIIIGDKCNSNMIKWDTCVMCGGITDEPLDRPIALRKNYIEGAGQLCEKCGRILSRGIYEGENIKTNGESIGN